LLATGSHSDIHIGTDFASAATKLKQVTNNLIISSQFFGPRKYNEK